MSTRPDVTGSKETQLGEARPMRSGGIVCLLPVFNEREQLPGFLAAAPAWCDAIVALDDGSTDESGDLLRASPLVARLLTRPPRAGYHDWDDASNRRALLRAADELRPDWVISLDADVRVDPDDAGALREFLATGALPGCAYGLQHYRMWGDDLYVPQVMWVYRVFAWRPGLELPDRRLHFNPLPTAIPRQAWVRTTVRLKHYGASADQAIERRLRKYQEADPADEFEGDFSGLSRRPAPPLLQRWPPRRRGLSVLWAPPGFPRRLAGDSVAEVPEAEPGAPELDLDLTGPVASVVLLPRDPSSLPRAVQAACEQRVSHPYEVLVVAAEGDDAEARALAAQDESMVRVVRAPRDHGPGAARNAALHAARGDYVLYVKADQELLPGAVEACIGAHEAGFDLVMGTTEFAGGHRWAWASYFLEHHRSLPRAGSGPSGGLPEDCSYHRQQALDAGGFPEEMPTGEDSALNRSLWRRSPMLYRSAELRVLQRPSPRPLRHLLISEVRRGQAVARIALEEFADSGLPLRPGRGPHRTLSAYRWQRVSLIWVNVLLWGGDLRPVFRRVRKGLMLAHRLSVAAAWLELLRPRHLVTLAGTLHRQGNRRPD